MLKVMNPGLLFSEKSQYCGMVAKELGYALKELIYALVSATPLLIPTQNIIYPNVKIARYIGTL